MRRFDFDNFLKSNCYKIHVFATNFLILDSYNEHGCNISVLKKMQQLEYRTSMDGFYKHILNVAKYWSFPKTAGIKLSINPSLLRIRIRQNRSAANFTPWLCNTVV